MANPGDDGNKRPSPYPRPNIIDDDEKTSAIQLDDLDLDAIQRPAPRPPIEDDEKTSAISLDEVMRAEQAAPRPSPRPAARPPARPTPAARPAPTPRPRQATRIGRSPSRPELLTPRPQAPAPQPAAPTPSGDDQDDQRTMAMSVDDLKETRERLLRERAQRAAAPSAPAPEPEPEDEEKTMAASVDDFEAQRRSLRERLEARRQAARQAAEPTPAPEPEPTPEPVPPADDGFERTVAVSLADLAPQGEELLRAQAMAAEPVEPEPEPPQLTVREGPDRGKSFPITKDLLLVGRGLDVDIVINDATASRRHFNVVRTHSGYKLVDLGSGNGTKVNGQRVSEVSLAPGMRIQAGATLMEWIDPEADAASAPAAAPMASPEEKTAFADIQAMNLEPEYPAEPDPAHAAFYDEDDDGDYEVSGGAGKKIGLIAAILAILVGGFVAADKFGKLGILFPIAKETTPVAEADPQLQEEEDAKAKAEAAKQEAGKKVNQATDVLAEGRYIAAVKLFDEALQIDPLVSGASDGLGTAGDEIEAIGKMAEAFTFVNEAKWEEAERTLNTLPKDSAVQESHESAIRAIRAEANRVRLNRAMELFKAGEFAEAKKTIALVPESEIGQAGIEQMKAAIELEASDEAYDEDKRADFDPVLKAYAEHDYMTAIDEADEIIHDEDALQPDVKRAQALGAAAMAFEIAMNQIGENKESPSKQLWALYAAMRADTIFGSEHRDDVYEALAKSWGERTKETLNRRQIKEAGLYGKIALYYAPEDEALLEIQETLIAQANKWLEEAADEEDLDDALDLYLRALWVLPKDHPQMGATLKAITDITKDAQ